ncbi:MAG: hypothetical protein ABFD97_07915 [Syntrophobacter sp.]
MSQCLCHWIGLATRYLITTVSEFSDFIFESLIKILFGKNPVYGQVRKGEESCYQFNFSKIVDSVNIDNLSNQARGNDFDRKQADRDMNTIDCMAEQSRSIYGLSAIVVKVMVMQYVYADHTLREVDKDCWIYKVMKNESNTYFPEASKIYCMLRM